MSPDPPSPPCVACEHAITGRHGEIGETAADMRIGAISGRLEAQACF